MGLRRAVSHRKCPKHSSSAIQKLLGYQYSVYFSTSRNSCLSDAKTATICERRERSSLFVCKTLVALFCFSSQCESTPCQLVAMELRVPHRKLLLKGSSITVVFMCKTDRNNRCGMCVWGRGFRKCMKPNFAPRTHSMHIKLHDVVRPVFLWQ